MKADLQRFAGLLILVCLACGWAVAIEVPLVYEKHAKDEEGFWPRGYTMVQGLGLGLPPGASSLPELVGRKPIHASVKLGVLNHFFVLTQQKKGDAFYSRLYFDSNGNQLLDEAPIDAETVSGPGETPASASFPTIEMDVDTGGVKTPYAFRLFVRCWQPEMLDKGSQEDMLRSVMVNLMTQCTYAGVAELDGRKYKVVLGDSNCNGVFNDVMQEGGQNDKDPDSLLRQEGDLFCFGDSPDLSYYDTFLLGSSLWLRETLYDVNIDIAGKNLSITPSTNTVFNLKLPVETESLILAREGGGGIMAFRPGRELKVPEGKFVAARYAVLRKDKQGDGWRLLAMATNATPPVSVEKNGAELVYGEPFEPIVSVPQWARQQAGSGEPVQLQFAVAGKGKERVVDLAHMTGNSTKIALSEKNTQRPKEPMYKIVTEDGETASQGTFEYG